MSRKANNDGYTGGAVKIHFPFRVGVSIDFSSCSKKRARGISRAPKLTKCSVVTWQSIKSNDNDFK
jgi:hypothetical protein